LSGQGETFQALEYFERLAKIFLTDGFTTKAIAIYKKVAKLAPEETRPWSDCGTLRSAGRAQRGAAAVSAACGSALKAGRQPQAAGLLRKLLEAEPENLRVHTKLANCKSPWAAKGSDRDLFIAIQRVHEHGDHAEAIRLAERLLKIDAEHLPTLTLKARALMGAGKRAEASTLLESFPDQDAGGETTAIC